MTTAKIDHQGLVDSLILTQYREATNLVAYTKAFLKESDEIEEVLRQLLDERFIDTAVGDQLDILGVIVGLPRTSAEYISNPFFGFLTAIGARTYSTLAAPSTGGTWRTLADPDSLPQILDDDVYRGFLKAKIERNHTDGTIEDVITVVELLFPTETIEITEPATAEFNIKIVAILTDTEKLILARNQFIPKPAGVFVTYEDNDGSFA